jgi:galactokinase
MVSLEAQVHQKFVELYKREPIIIRSPGRINLIGEHTDYNEGFVMPAAIDKRAVFAIAPSDTEQSEIFSIKYNQEFVVNLDDPEKVDEPIWANYLLGVLDRFVERGFDLKPFNCVFGGDIPVGAGMSSSAAIECGFGFALNELNNLGVSKIEIVKIGQWAEHHYVGVLCGIMDQFASVMGKDGHVIVLDCRSLTHTYAPINLKEYMLVLCDTKVKHSLVDSEYNTRRHECETGVKILRQHHPDIKSLRDVSMEMLEDHRSEFSGKVYDRCRYVVEEIARVPAASEDLGRGDLKAFGKKMYETHEGLSSLYQVSCAELDFFVAEAKKFPEILGARMMGGGFGGCTINIIRKDFVTTFEEHLRKAYREKFNHELETYHVDVEGGTSVVQLTDLQIQ